jgi:DNA polymerase IIIc chi subunit
MNTSRVVFFQVRDNTSKLKHIVDTVTAHFHKKEPILIFVEDDRAQQFVDDLLWKLPETSFLPHTPIDDLSPELIVITKSKINCNDAKIAFNL